jgi:FMN-dependent NADH-azoreductase
MKKILVIETSPRGSDSVTHKVTEEIANRLMRKYPGSTVVTKNLNTTPYPHLTAEVLTAMRSPAEARTKEQDKLLALSDSAIEEVMEADFLIIAAPMWNYSIPSGLKAWIDHVARAGKTFQYTSEGPIGLLTGKVVYVAIASGGIYSSGPQAAINFIEPYFKAIFSLLGINEVRFALAEGVAIPGLQESSVQKAFDQISV